MLDCSFLPCRWLFQLFFSVWRTFLGNGLVMGKRTQTFEQIKTLKTLQSSLTCFVSSLQLSHNFLWISKPFSRSLSNTASDTSKIAQAKRVWWARAFDIHSTLDSWLRGFIYFKNMQALRLQNGAEDDDERGVKSRELEGWNGKQHRKVNLNLPQKNVCSNIFLTSLPLFFLAFVVGSFPLFFTLETWTEL